MLVTEFGSGWEWEEGEEGLGLTPGMLVLLVM